MHMRRAVVSFFGTMTGLATHSDSLSSRINPALRSRLTSSQMAFLFGSKNRRIVCCTGLALGSTLRACSASSLGIPGMSDGSHANISQRSRRNSMSAPSYATVRSADILTVFFGSVGCTCSFLASFVASNSSDLTFRLSAGGCV